MSENETPQTPKRPKKQLSHEQFYKLCEAMKANYDSLKTVTSIGVVIAKLEEILAFSVSKEALKRACKTLNLTFKFRYQVMESGRLMSHVRTITNVLVSHFKELGVPVPNALLDIQAYYYPAHANQQPQKPAALPIPVKEVPKPSTIPIVNQRRQ